MRKSSHHGVPWHSRLSGRMGKGIDEIIIDFSKTFELVPHDRLLTNLASSGVDSRVVICVSEFFVGRTQNLRVGGQLSNEVKVASGVPQGSIFVTLLFLVYVNDIWRSIDQSMRLLADDWIIYRKITNKNYIGKLQKDLNILGEWAVENGMKLNSGKCKALRFTRAYVKNPLG